MKLALEARVRQTLFGFSLTSYNHYLRVFLSCYYFYSIYNFEELFVYPKKGTGKSGKSQVPAEHFYSDPEWLPLKGPTPPERQKHASGALNASADFEVDHLNRQQRNQ